MRASLGALFFTATFVAAPAVKAQTWRIVPSVTWESTFTNNVDLTSVDRRSDWVNQFTPAVRFDERGSHSKLTGSIALPVLVYARTSDNNYVAPEANISGTYEAIDHFLFVDATANVSQQYQSPFGARSVSLVNATENRYTAQTYSISPYIKVERPEGLSYHLRQQSIWSNAGGVTVGPSTNRSFTSNVDGDVARQSGITGVGLQYNRSDIHFTDLGNTVGGSNETTQIVRLRALYRPDPNVQVSASVGYEDNQFFVTEERGTTYGVGVVWHPTDRTNLDASLEHRFFGASYHVAFDHRTPLTVWALSAVRDLTTYPQQLATLPAGGSVTSILNSLFASRVTDPIQRQALVDQIIQNRGLPTQLSTPLAIYAQQLTLVESVTASFGILGARNSVFFTAYYSNDEPAVRDEDLAPLVGSLTKTRQNGGSVAWAHQLSSSLSLTASADTSRASDSLGLTTRFYALNATLSTPLSPLTTAYTGVRYQHSNSNSEIAASYSEFAVFVGLSHTFR